ncbi:hypothetical protein KAU43_06245 [candidate division WOR-3 bacterium]|nr:hypothetical protein [candidate division WOR-3 bacterium]
MEGNLVKQCKAIVMEKIAQIDTPARFDKKHKFIIIDEFHISIYTGMHKNTFDIREMNRAELGIIKKWLGTQLCTFGEDCKHPYGHCDKCGSYRIQEDNGKALCLTCLNEWEHKSKSEGDE